MQWVLAVEDDLSAAVGQRLLQTHKTADISLLQRTGNGYLRTRIKSLTRLQGLHVLILTYLDQFACPVELMRQWKVPALSSGVLFRVAVREIESWLLADQQALSRYLNVAPELIPERPDDLPDPKATLVKVASYSPVSDLKRGIAPAKGRTVKVGPQYNSLLTEFVERQWSPTRAARHSDSLRRSLARIRSV